MLRKYRHPWQSASAKRRHPWDRGSPAQRAVTDAFRPLLCKAFWAKHEEPFAKSPAGRARRAERRFKQQARTLCQQDTMST